MKTVRSDKKRVGVAGAAVSRGLRFNSGDWKAILPCSGWRACPPTPDSCGVLREQTPSRGLPRHGGHGPKILAGGQLTSGRSTRADPWSCCFPCGPRPAFRQCVFVSPDSVAAQVA